MGTDLRVIVDAQTAGFKRGMDGVLRTFSDVRRAHVETAATTRVLERETRALTRALDEQRRSLGGLTLQFTAFRNALRTAALRTAITGFAALTSSIASAGGELIMLTTSLGAFGGALGTVGASALGGLAQGALVATLALKGVGKALTTTGTEHVKALGKLTKPARAFVGEIAKMRDGLREVKLLAQQGLFEGLTRAVAKAAPLLQPLKQVVYDTAQAMGYLSERIADVAVKHKDDLLKLGERNVVTLRRMGDAAINFGEAFMNVLRAADPLIGHITAGIVTFSQHMDDASAKARANGSLRSTFDYLRKSYDAWTSTIGNFGRIISGVIQAAAGPSLDLARSIDKVTAKWAAWTHSVQGQKGLSEYFANSQKVMGAFGKLLGDVVVMFAHLAGPGSDSAVAFFTLLDTKLLPVIEQAARSFNDNLFPAFMNFAGALLQLLSDVMPGLEALGGAFTALLTAAADVTDGIGQLTDGLGPLPRALAALTLGAGVIAGWRKLADVFGLAFLSLRRFLGLTPELASVMRIGLPMMLARGGAAGGGAQGGGAISQSMVPVMATGRGGVGPVNERPVLAPRMDSHLGLRQAVSEHFTPIFPSTASSVGRISNVGTEQLGPTRRPYGAAADPTRWAGATAVPRYGVSDPLPGYAGFRNRLRVPEPVRARIIGYDRTRAPYALSGPGTPIEQRPMAQLPPGYRTQAYRNFQNTDLTGGGGRAGRLGANIAGFSGNLARETTKGLVAGAQAAKPVFGAVLGTAAITGFITALSSGSSGLSNKLQDFFAGATFGAIKTSSQKADEKAGGIAGLVQGGTFTAGQLDQFNNGRGPNLSESSRKALYGGGIVNGKPTAGSLDTKIDLRTNPAQVKALQELVANMQKGGQLAPDAAAKIRSALGSINTAMDKLGGQGVKGKELQQALALGLDIDAPVGKAIDGIDRVKDAFVQIGLSKGLDQLKANVHSNIEIINGELGRGSKVGRLALAKNFTLAAQAVRDQMKAAGKTTKDGTALINHYMIAALGQMGLSHSGAVKYLSGIDPVGGKSTQGSISQTATDMRGGVATTFTQAPGAAHGALSRIPGKVGPDSVPMRVGAQNIVAAPGEDVAILTRHQRAEADRRFSDVGGFAGLFTSVPAAHNHPGFATGGMVTGDTDYKPAMSKALQAMARDTGTSIFVQSGGRTAAEQQALINQYGAHNPNHPVAGLNGPHVQGIAADITPGRDAFAAVAGKYGLGFTVSNEPWHIQLLNAISDLTGGSSGSGAAAVLKRVVSSMAGAPGALVNTGLGIVGDLAQSIVNQAQTSMGGGSGAGGDGTGPVAPSGKTGGSAAAKAYAQAHLAKYGWGMDQWNPLDLLWTGESGWDPNAVNKSSGAAGIPQALGHGHVFDLGDFAAQVDWGMNYIDATYGTPAHAYAEWLARDPHWYEQGGLVHAAGGTTIPARNGTTPTVDPADAITKGSTKKKKKAKPKLPFTSGSSYPNLSAIKGTAKGAAKKKTTRYSKWSIPDGAPLLFPGVLPNFKALFDDPADTISNRIDAMTAAFGLSDEQAVVTLTDTSSYKDLSAFWALHPDLAATYQNNVDSFDVLNTSGMSVQGKFTPGIEQHVSELQQLLTLHTGLPDGTGATGLMGLFGGELGSMTKTSGALSTQRDIMADQVRQIHHAWNAEHERRAHAIDKTRKLKAGGQTWQARVGDNDARIKALQDWKRQVRADTVGHRQTADLKKQLVKADQDIADLREESDTLTSTHPAPKHALPKNATAAQKAAAAVADAGRSKQLSHWTTVRDGSAQELDFLAGSRDSFSTTSGAAAQWQARLDAYNGALSDVADSVKTLDQVTLPAERTTVASIAQEMGDWLGTNVPLPNLGTDGASGTALTDVLAQQNDQLLRQHAVDTAQFQAMLNFGPLAGMRMVGAFAHGGPITDTGMALVHKGEYVVPDPTGPYVNRAAADAQGGGAPQEIRLTIDGDLAPLVGRMQASVDGRVLTVSSERAGRRARMIANAPGGGR